MKTAPLCLLLCAAVLSIALENATFAQESLPLTSPGATQSRSYVAQEQMKRQFRTWQAQYQAVQGMMREEQYKWLGYNPQRPIVNSGEAFNVPYNNLAYPNISVGRTLFYHGGSAFHY